MNPGGLAVMTTALSVSTVLVFSTGPQLTVFLASNATESAAIGFYTIEPTGKVRVEDQVLSRLPGPVADLADQRRYVPATTPVLKTIAAQPGGVVCRMGSVVTIDGRTVALARHRDHAGRPLSVWSGCQRLEPGEVFLLGRHPDSFDGRYFGPTPAALILGKARPLWTW